MISYYLAYLLSSITFGERVPRKETVERRQPEIDAAIKIRRSVQRFARQLRFRRVGDAISGTKRSILGTLFRSGKPLTLTELARLERLQPQSLTRAIAELEETQLIERTNDEIDRRQLLISITDVGRDLLIVDARAQIHWLGATISTHMSKAEQQMLLIASDLIERICDISDAHETNFGAAAETGSSDS